jgi:hypothetical protein
MDTSPATPPTIALPFAALAESPPSEPPARPQANARKRELLRQYKDNPPAAGVYAIRCAASGFLVVSAAMNVAGAINRERFQLRLNGHRNKTLQREWNAHGEAAFSFETIDVLKPREDSTDAQQRDDLAALLAMWREELGA